jgi:hypothetical protein
MIYTREWFENFALEKLKNLCSFTVTANRVNLERILIFEHFRAQREKTLKKPLSQGVRQKSEFRF